MVSIRFGFDQNRCRSLFAGSCLTKSIVLDNSKVARSGSKLSSLQRVLSCEFSLLYMTTLPTSSPRGLSATVGSPEIFNTWLKSVQEAHGFKHTFVQHPYRYSHLRKFYYLLDEKRKADSFTGLNGYRPTSSTRFLHPISMMSFGTRSMPSDLALEAQDTLTLYQALVRHNRLLGLGIDALEPQRFFAESKGKLLTQKDIIRYEAALKYVLSPIFATFDPTDPSSPLRYILNELTDTMIANVPASSLNATPLAQVFLDNLIYLISDLHANDSLVRHQQPCFRFTDNPPACYLVFFRQNRL